MKEKVLCQLWCRAFFHGNHYGILCDKKHVLREKNQQTL